MLVDQKIVVTYQVETGDENAPLETFTLTSDGRRWTTECDSCGIMRRSYRFTSSDIMADGVSSCLDCLVEMPDVTKIVIG
jgi:hypothetical protein